MRRLLSTAIHRLCATASVAAVMAAAPVLAQTTTYQYTGNTFTQFSCGPFIDSTTGQVTGTASCSTPAPTNPNTSYTLTDKITATLIFDAPLPVSMAMTSVTGLAGFHLTLNDGHQTVQAPGVGLGIIATVATDASGNISEWRLIINTGGTLNGGVSTQKFTNTSTGSLVQSDMGTLACCHPTMPGDFGRRSGLPGVWNVSGGTPEPDELVENLIDVVFDPDTALTTGQISSLSDKLINALASIDAGLVKQAINQLNSFIASVQVAVKTGKMNSGTGAALIAAANEIIAMLQP
jgi:hypothetical protein